MAEKKLMVPREAFFMAIKNGAERQYNPSRPVWSTDPAVKKHPELFIEVAEQVHDQGTVVQTATAAPGEKRATKPGKKKDAPGE